MATKSEELSQVERIREVIRKLDLALEKCNQLLDEAERSVLLTGQDNDRPLTDS
jgi:hypothetical protein